MNGFKIEYLVSVFLGGGVGATMRWLFSIIGSRLTDRIWASTLFVNLLGCFLFFLVLRFISSEARMWNMLIKVGFLGSLTTFSTFAFELTFLIKSGRYLETSLVLLLNVLFGVAIGIWMFRQEIV